MAGEEGTSAVISFCPQKTEDLGDKVGDGKTGARVLSLDSSRLILLHIFGT